MTYRSALAGVDIGGSGIRPALTEIGATELGGLGIGMTGAWSGG